MLYSKSFPHTGVNDSSTSLSPSISLLLKKSVYRSAGLPAMDPLLVRFYRQYMQQIPNLTFPPSKLLLEPDIQDQVYRHFFNDSPNSHPVYQRRVLKQVISLIERAMSDPEEDCVADPLMEHMGYLSSLPKQSDAAEASQTRILTYTLPEELDAPTPPTILIEEAPNLLAAGSNVGLRTWEASLHLAQYLHSNPGLVTGKNIIELGAGTGLVSILCAGPLEAETVLSTDGLPHVVETIEENIMRNRDGLFGGSASRRLPIARVLDWADTQSLEEKLAIDETIPEYSLILGADITYSPDVVPLLAQLLKILMVDMFARNNMEALISGTVRNEHTLKVFTEACVEQGLVIEYVTFNRPSVKEQKGFFHEQAFPIVIMRIRKSA